MEAPDGFVSLITFGTFEEASQAVRDLLEWGIGSDVRVEESDSNVLVGSVTCHALYVLANDAPRAREALGLEESAPAPPEAEAAPAPVATSAVAEAAAGGRDEEKIHRFLGGRLVLTGRQLTAVLLTYAAALVVLPVVAYYGTRYVLAEDVEEPDITVPGVVEVDDAGNRLFERDEFLSGADASDGVPEPPGD